VFDERRRRAGICRSKVWQAGEKKGERTFPFYRDGRRDGGGDDGGSLGRKKEKRRRLLLTGSITRLKAPRGGGKYELYSSALQVEREGKERGFSSGGGKSVTSWPRISFSE